MKPRTLTEHEECVLLADYLELLRQRGDVLNYTHIPNETYTKSWKQKMKNKREGVRSGVPDYFIITKNQAIFIEMKRTKGGVLSETQKEWIMQLELVGIPAYTCKGFSEARKVVDKYI